MEKVRQRCGQPSDLGRLKNRTERTDQYNNNNNNNNTADRSSDNREISFLFQRLSVLIQWYNAILLNECFVKEEEKE